MTRLPAKRRLLTIGHSYSVALNRRLAHELACTGRWDVTAAAPSRFRGDFTWHTARPEPGERCRLAPVPVHFSRPVHLMLYGSPLAALLREPWDLVHCWEEPYVAAAAQVARLTPPGVPLVFATFQNIVKRYPPPFNWIERYTTGRADAVIAFGRTVEDALRAKGLGAVPTRVIPPGVDTQRFRPDADLRARCRRALGWSDAGPVVGFLGRFVPEKGLALLMSALDGLDVPWRALFVGSGPLEPSLRQWAGRYGDRVAVETTVGHDEVPPYLNAMDVLCAPSQTTPRWREQFGRMIIEAFACGVPVIASTSGEIPHVVGSAGLLVEERDRGGWVDAIRRVLSDESLRLDLAGRGRRRAVTLFDWPVVARQHADFFESLVAEPAPACEVPA